MMKNLKKLIAITLVAALTLGGGLTTAFAATTETAFGDGFDSPTSGKVTKPIGATLTVNTLVAIPEIKVTIGTLSDMILNPYKLSYKTVNTVLGINTLDDTATESNSVISDEVLITSESYVQLEIKATPRVTKCPSGLDTMFITAASGKSDTTPWVFLWLEMVTGTLKADAGSYASDVSDLTVTWVDGPPAESSTDEKAVVKKVDAVEEADTAFLELAAIDDTHAEQYGAFRLTGECGGNPWDQSKFTGESGEIEITIIFNINPVVASESNA